MGSGRQPALSRYELRGVLGHGGAGVVYEAYDRLDHTVVALKVLRDPVADELRRLKQEFRSLADLQHPNLVRYGELASEQGEWFFTMELVRGKRTFVDYVRAAQFSHRAVTASDARVVPLAEHDGGAAPSSPPPTGTFDESRLRSVLGQLVSALLTLHASGRVHRDVKPSNVLVTDEGRVVLLDFGLVMLHAGRDPLDEGAIAGTPAFMAPEQARGDAVDEAADWYAVGVMLFAALTGALPFDGSTATILADKATREAPSAAWRAAGLPGDLVALCAALLRRDPAERPRGAEIAARLGLGSAEALASSVRPPQVPFVGRGAELRELESALDDVRAGRARRVIVEGEPGIGKSALVQRFLGAAGDVLVLAGRCYEQESVPFKGVDGIVDALSDHLASLSTGELRSATRGGIRYLARVFPVLQRVTASSDSVAPRDVGDPAALREQAFGELQRLLAALTSERTLALVVDDLQWADQDSVELLQRALLGAESATCLFVATMRAGAGAAIEASALVQGATRVPLAALTADESRALLDALVRSRAPGDEASRQALIVESHGHPLYLAELARSVSSRPPSHAAGSARLQDVLWERIQERDAIDRSLLETIAVAGAPVPHDVAARAAGVDVGECNNRLGGLRAAHLVRVGRRGTERLIEPYHDRVREAILPRLGDERTDLHLRLARALLESTSEDALDQRVFAIVQHLNAARARLVDPEERRRAAALNLRASRQAHLATAYARARDHAAVGLELLGESAWTEAYAVTRDLHLARMTAEMFAGDAAAAAACFEAIRAHVTDVADRTQAYVAWIALQTSRGQLVDAIDTGRARLRELGTRAPAKASPLSVLRQYARCRWLQGRQGSAELLHLPRVEDAVSAGVIEIVGALTPAAFFVDTNLLAWLALEGVARSLRRGVSDVSAYCFAVYGTVLTAAFEKHEEGESFGRLALALNERFQNRKLAARLHFLYGGWHSPWVRPFADGLAFLRTAHELASKYGDTAYETYAASTRSLVAFSESASLESLQEMGEWARQIGERRLDADMAGFADVFARYAAALRAPEGEATTLDLSRDGSSDADLRASFTDAATPSSVYYYFYCAAELAYLAGDAPRARALLDEAWKRTQVVFGLPTTVDLWWLDALVSARLHDDAPWTARVGLRRRVAKRVAKLRAWARSCPANFEAYAYVARAELARIDGDLTGAEAELERAVTAARAHRAPKREAFALDLACRVAELRGAEPSAKRREAAEAYRRWGRGGTVAKAAL